MTGCRQATAPSRSDIASLKGFPFGLGLSKPSRTLRQAQGERGSLASFCAQPSAIALPVLDFLHDLRLQPFTRLR